MFSVRIEDNREGVKALLTRKLLAACQAAAESMADGYKFALQSRVAPPHSKLGEIPHAYLGYKPGGFGPTNPTGINNIPPEFSSVQSDYLSSYIEGGASGEFGDVSGFVGFAPSHVTTRDQNYLLYHDRAGRPWVVPTYRREKQAVARAANNAFEGTT